MSQRTAHALVALAHPPPLAARPSCGPRDRPVQPEPARVTAAPGHTHAAVAREAGPLAARVQVSWRACASTPERRLDQALTAGAHIAGRCDAPGRYFGQVSQARIARKQV